MSGVDLDGRRVRKGAADAVTRFVEEQGSPLPPDVRRVVEDVAKQGATPLVVADGAKVLGVVQLKDIVKGGIQERFAEMRRIGIKTVMITGDNPLTATAIAAEAGVDDFLAEATPEAKLAMIRDYQQKGHLVAMTGDGTNDAPALAQADVAVAMNTGTQAAKEAGNMVDLDSNPTKLLAVVEIGKQMLMTRGALTTFSIANDVSKYFAIIPAAFAATYPQLVALNVVRRHLQRAHHRRPHPAGAARDPLSTGACLAAAPPQSARLRAGRRRSPVPLHQAHRRLADRARRELSTLEPTWTTSSAPPPCSSASSRC
jgi:K+-transporting ATPase ATPase B chain